MNQGLNQNPEWRAVRMRLVQRAQAAGWRWGRDPRSGANGLALVSPRGTLFEFRMRGGRLPEVRRYQDFTLHQGEAS